MAKDYTLIYLLIYLKIALCKLVVLFGTRGLIAGADPRPEHPR